MNVWPKVYISIFSNIDGKSSHHISDIATSSLIILNYDDL